MSFKYDSANKVFLQRDVYLYADDQEVEGSDFLQNLSAYDKDRTWLKKQEGRWTIYSWYLVQEWKFPLFLEKLGGHENYVQ